MAETPAQATPEANKYWLNNPGVAPIKSEYVLWHKLKSHASVAIDDDAAEGRSTPAATKPLRTGDIAAVPPQTADPSSSGTTASEPSAQVAGTESVSAAPGLEGASGTTGPEDEPAEKKVKLSGAQKKALARQKQQEQWEAKKAAMQAAKQAKGEAAEGGEAEGEGRKKVKGQNKGRKFDHYAGSGEIRLCNHLAQGKPCERPNCRADHDLAGYLAARLPDIRHALPTTSDDLTTISATHTCPLFLSLGSCPFGFKCRFGESHMKKVEEGQGFMGSGWELLVDEEKVKQRESEKGEGLGKKNHMAEMNFLSTMQIKDVRGGGRTEEKFPLSAAYLKSIGEPLDNREDTSKGKGKKRGRDGKEKEKEKEQKNPAVPEFAAAEAAPSTDSSNTAAAAIDAPRAPADAPAIASTSSTSPEAAPPTPAADNVDSHPSRSFIPDLAPLRATEKKRLNFKDKLWMAPLTTVGNLPFRRIAVEYGCDITVSEMGLAQEFLSGNANEWSLVRRHPSEKTFGVQICGSKPQVLVPAAEAIARSTEIDFLDVNCGCPIDLVFNKGAGSALLAHANKLGKALVGMNKVLGDVPLTIKIRTGVNNSQPTAHKLMPRLQKEWGLQAVTMHGRSRQQRYKALADYKYIGECVKVLRETAADEGVEPIPIFGNGDAYDHRAYWDNVESSGVDGIMIARGALIKPWIFTEIKERRDWDISSRERLDMIGKLCDYGLEHWGSDQLGVNKTRRFCAEAMSFTHRYIPVGLLERGLENRPIHMNERSYPYKGRDELETLLASDQAKDWINITSMFLGPPPDDWKFLPKHKAAATESETQG